MYAGRKLGVAIAQARANARWTGTPRYVRDYLGNQYVERDPPSDPSVNPYVEVSPDGTIAFHGEWHGTENIQIPD
jgi:hypothetical protein